MSARAKPLPITFSIRAHKEGDDRGVSSDGEAVAGKLPTVMLIVGVASSDGATTRLGEGACEICTTDANCEFDIVAVGPPSNEGDEEFESVITPVALAAGDAIPGESDCDIDIAGADEDGGGGDPESVATAARLCEDVVDAENDNS